MAGDWGVDGVCNRMGPLRPSILPGEIGSVRYGAFQESIFNDDEPDRDFKQHQQHSPSQLNKNHA
ncbi:hypothetical protein PspLS_09739 [Pyricularia sp. CBS 133598]|nr:hypothetical protein PspLS_09739 [Pyricularia sp. CBS 133598]